MNIELVNQTLLGVQHVLEGALGDSVIRISFSWCDSPHLEVHMCSKALDDFMAQTFKSSCDEFPITVFIALGFYYMYVRLDTVEYLFLLNLQEMKDFLNKYPGVSVEWGSSDGSMEVLHVG